MAIPRLTRRVALIGSAVGLSGLGLAAGMMTRHRVEPAPSVKDAQLAGPLGDVWLGSQQAKVTLIEYAALTCTHCANFHAETWPTIKADWIDTGQVRFALRGFALSPLDTAAFMLARADRSQHYYALIDLLFEKQASWAFVQRPLDALRDLMRQLGFDSKRFDAILNDQDLYNGVNLVRSLAASLLGVHSTPTLYVNDTFYEGERTRAALGAAIAKSIG